MSLSLCACGHHASRTTSPTSGAQLFAQKCAACHGNGGVNGPVGPSLRGEGKRKSIAAIATAIEEPQPPMPKLFPAELSAQDVADLSAYVEHL